jgi:hypothetical protein
LTNAHRSPFRSTVGRNGLWKSGRFERGRRIFEEEEGKKKGKDEKSQIIKENFLEISSLTSQRTVREGSGQLEKKKEIKKVNAIPKKKNKGRYKKNRNNKRKGGRKKGEHLSDFFFVESCENSFLEDQQFIQVLSKFGVFL